MSFGLVAIGSSGRKELIVHNAGRASLRLDRATLPGPYSIADFPSEGLMLGGGESITLAVLFSPEAEGSFEGVLSIGNDSADEPLDVPLAGSGVRALASLGATELQFGEVVIGASEIRELELANDSALPVEVRLRIDGIDADSFACSSADAPLVVDPGERRPVPVAFHPLHLGSAEAQLLVAPCPGCAETAVALHGDGIASCISVTPGSVDFGTVEVDRELSQVIEILNNGNAAVEVREVFLTASSSADFRFDGFFAGSARTLAVGGSMSVTVYFKPSSRGARAGALRIRAGDETRECWSEVRLSGAGGTGCLELAPESIDFGTVASGMSARQALFAANTGCGSDVWIERVEMAGDPELNAAPLRQAPFLLQQGEVAEIAVTFSPAAPGSYRGVLHIEAADDKHRPLSSPPGDVPVIGGSRALAPCDFEVVPPRMDFGTLEVGARAELAFKVVNLGMDACYLSNLGLTLNSSPVFQIVDGAAPGLMLPAGESHDVRVGFNPLAPGSFVGNLELYVSDGADPYRTYPISGQAARGCLSVQPRDLDFGTVYVACPPPVMTSIVRNGCSGPVALQSVVRGPGTSSELTLAQLPSFPLTLGPGETLPLQVRYAPIDEGLDSMPIFLDDGTSRHLVSVRGAGLVDPERIDAFNQSLQERVDVLFVLDNSGSMADKQAAVGANLSSFLRDAITQGVDYHLAVTTTGLEPSTGGWTTCAGGAEGGEGGRLFPVDSSRPRIITPFTPNPEAVWAANTAVGVCHWLEQGLEASYRALTTPLVDHTDDPRTVLPGDGNAGFLREDAKLVLVYVSDEDDQSQGSVEHYLTFLQSLKSDPAKLAVSVIVSPQDLTTCVAGTAPGTRYIELANRTGGQVESICTPDWASSLERLGSNAFGAQSVFPLSAEPADPGQITVTVNGAVVPAGEWTYDSEANAVVFTEDAVPSAGSHIEISYPLGCG